MMRHTLAWFAAASCALLLNACYDADVGGGGDDDGGSSGFGGSLGGTSGKGGSSGFGGSTGGNISTGGTGGVSGFGGSTSTGGASGFGGSSGTGGVPPDASCASAENTLNQCGLLEGALPECDDTAQDDRCASGCTVDATCTELTDFFCSNALNAFYDCLMICASVSAAPPPSGSFTCNDGQAIPAGYRCDGYIDCAAGEDELDCDFVCSDGTTIPQSYVCDGGTNCSTGEDEAGCAGTFTCFDGEVIPASYVCDDFDDCSSGEDEADCGGSTFPICGTEQ